MNNDKNKIKTYLFNPFYYVAGSQALLFGIIIILLTGVVASFGNVHFISVLETNIGAQSPFWVYLVEGIVNWIIFSIFILIGGAIISSTRYRLIDVFGTQALARFPMLLFTLIALLPNKFFVPEILSQTNTIKEIPPNDALDFALFCVMIIVMLFMGIWMIVLMYKAYSTSFNIKGTKAIVVFIAIMIISSLVSGSIFKHVVNTELSGGKELYKAAVEKQSP